MAVVDIHVDTWFYCVRHDIIFAGFDPIWSRGKHEECNVRTIDRTTPVIVINDPGYNPKVRETQRVLMCSECGGKGELVAYDPMTRAHCAVTCGSCLGWGYR